MKKIFTCVCICIFAINFSKAQVTCSNNGNLVLFTNYDGGVLNINVDVNMPNIKIGICSYEAMIVNLSGAYVNNVTAIQYAGYNGQNAPCGVPPVPITIINGAPAGVTPVIQTAPAAPYNTPNGYPSIICGYSCDTTVQQGGCNTTSQIEAYFMGVWPGSLKRMHKVQYNCWTGTHNISGGGTALCCYAAAANITVSISAIQPTCHDQCNGSATAVATGGTPPYTYNWVGAPPPPGATYSSLCPGTYTVVVADAVPTSVTQTVTITNPPAIVTNVNQTACFSYFFNGNNITTSGLYKDTLQSAAFCDSVINLNLTINTVNAGINQSGTTLTAAASGASYIWYNCGTNSVIPGATAQSYTPPASGNYAVIVTQNNCTDTSVCKNVVVTGIADINEKSLISVYPNPVNDELNIDIDKKYTGQYCYFYDALGRVVYKQILNHTTNKIPVSQLSKGIYTFAIEGVNTKWKVQK